MARTSIRHGQIRRHTSTTLTEEDLLKGRYFRASCPDTLVVNNLVYINGPGAGELYSVALADPRDLGKMPAIGIVAEKQTATECLVVRHGRQDGFTGLTPNGVYFVGLDGNPSLTPPTALTGQQAGVLKIGRAISSTVMMIDIADIMVKVRG